MKKIEKLEEIEKPPPMVLVTGLEPVRSFGPRDFKSLASAYFATPAKKDKKKVVTRTRIELVLPP